MYPENHSTCDCLHENDRTCPACPYSDEEIDFEQYSSGYSSAEVSLPHGTVLLKDVSLIGCGTTGVCVSVRVCVQT